MKILAIETSCDETAIALVEARGGLRKPQFKVLKNTVSSQVKVHRPFGGVVPNLAKREHIKNLPKIFDELMSYSLRPTVGESKTNKLKRSVTQAKRNSLTVDMIAVTVGPGLEPALWAGIEFAKSLTRADLADKSRQRRNSKHEARNSKQIQNSKFKIPNGFEFRYSDFGFPALVGVNHLEGHLYSNWLPSKSKKPRTLNIEHRTIRFPAIALLVSGGHTILLLMKSLTKWKKLGETRDDAAGEAFDKVARLLNLPYPGGPEIEKMAIYGSSTSIDFPRPMLKDKSYDFSFSGLKTAVLYYLRDNFNLGTSDVPNIASNLRTSDVQNIAASFQQAVIDVLVGKTIRAAKEFDAKSVLLCGGVAANRALRDNLELRTKNLGLNFYVPDFEYNTDNAAMIAVAAYIQKLKGKRLRLTAQSNLNL